MGERLSGGNVAIALLANTIATGAALVGLILTFGPISGAHFNLAVTLVDAIEHGIPWHEVPLYVAAQCLGGITGAVVAHLMFRLRWYSPVISCPERKRSSFQRVHCDLRADVSDLGMLSRPLVRSALCGRLLHHVGILVHGVHVVCKSCGDDCPFVLRYIRWYPACRRPVFHHRAACRGIQCNNIVSLAGPWFGCARCRRGGKAFGVGAGMSKPDRPALAPKLHVHKDLADRYF